MGRLQRLAQVRQNFPNLSGRVMKLISRMSPPQLRHASGNASPTRANNFAQVIPEVS